MADEQEDYDYGELIVVQHADFAGPDALTEMLDGRAARRPYLVLRPDLGEALPDLPGNFKGVISLGGPQGVGDQDDLPWIADEARWLGAAVEAGIPVLGVCLGSQLLATALGASVTTRETPEIGLIELTRTPAGQEDEIFAGWVDGASALFIHDDEVASLPADAVELATGSDGIAAWRAADGLSYGVQFHPEVSSAVFAEWAEQERNLPRFQRAGVDPAALVEDFKARERFVRAASVSLVGRWVDGVVGRDDPSPRRRPRKAA